MYVVTYTITLRYLCSGWCVSILVLSVFSSFLLIIFVLRFFFLFLAWVFLLNDAAAELADILSFVSVGHVVENARLVDVDGGAIVACEQAVSFVVVHGRSCSHQIHHSTMGSHFNLSVTYVLSAQCLKNISIFIVTQFIRTVHQLKITFLKFLSHISLVSGKTGKYFCTKLYIFWCCCFVDYFFKVRCHI